MTWSLREMAVSELPRLLPYTYQISPRTRLYKEALLRGADIQDGLFNPDILCHGVDYRLCQSYNWYGDLLTSREDENNFAFKSHPSLATR